MENRKIPSINDEFDLKLLLFIGRKNLYLIFIFLAITLSSSYLYLRYTYPLYEAKTTIQLDVKDETNKFMFFQEQQATDENIANRIELLRSPTFLKRALSKLPLDISYFSEGTVLENESYESSQYIVSAIVKSDNIYNIPFFISFSDNNKVKLTYDINDKSIENRYSIGDTISLPEVKLFIKIIDLNSLKSGQSIINSDKYYFVINNPKDLVKRYLPTINIKLINDAAKTIEINVREQNPKKSADIANTVASEFLAYDIEKQAEGTDNVLKYIDDQIEKKYTNLYDSENILDSFKIANGLSIDTTNDIFKKVIDKSTFEALDNQKFSLENELKMLKSLQFELTNTYDFNIYKIAAIIAGSQFQGAVSNILADLQNLLLKKEQMLYEVTTKSGQIEAINYQINIRKKLLLESIKTIVNNIEESQKDVVQELSNIKNSIKVKNQDINTLEFNKLQRLFNINQSYFNDLIQKRAEYELEKAGYVSKNIILDQATVPTSPISPIKRNIYLMAIAFALFLGLIIIVIKYLFYNQIISINDITKYTSVPVLGIVPKYRYSIPVSQLIVDKHPKSLLAESLRSIRTNLQFLNNDEGPKIISFTSTISGEGKTFMAINFAGIIAFSGKKVVVIDFDLRKPKIHMGFGISNKKGISTILSNRDVVDDCINLSEIHNLSFITAGPIPPNPSELIFSDNTNKMIDYLKTKYDYIIIDNPPVGLVTDGMKGLTIADYPIYVFKANYSKKFYIENLNRIFLDGQVRKISLVLNAAEPIYLGYSYKYKNKSNNSSSYGYGYGFGYGYGYFDEENYTSRKKSFKKKLFQFFKIKINY